MLKVLLTALCCSKFILPSNVTSKLSPLNEARNFYDPHFANGHGGIVQLFEWKWEDIANECEFLADKKYGGIQISPPNENVIIPGRPWYERYQPISYKLLTRSGNERDFLKMTKKCNAVGVRIYVDSVFNHMAANQAEKIANGTGNSWAVPENRMYPAVPYDSSNFHPPCALVDYNDAYQVRNCELVGLHDLNQTVEDTRNKIVNYLNYMIDLGVAGFRIDAAKHQWPNDLEIIYNRLKKLNTSFGFAENSDPFIYQEVIDTGNEAVSKYEYIFAVVTEFRYSSEIGRSFTGNDDLKWLQSFGEKWDLLPSHLAMTFIDDHDSQRSGGDGILTYKKRKNYIMAQAFSLAHPYGHKRIMSSFNFDNNDQGPPTDKHENILTPSIDATGNCVNGWVCEHRFHAIYSMVEFMNTVATEPISDWWDNDKNQIAFSRGSKGFVAFNLDKRDMSNVTIITPMAPGVYCDIISGQLLNNKCTGKQLEVSSVHTITINLPNDDPNGVVAIHAGHQVTKNSYNRNSWRRKPIKKNIIPEVIKAPIQNN